MARAMQHDARKAGSANDDSSVKATLRDQPVARAMTPGRCLGGSMQGVPRALSATGAW